jgi:4-carboxymuconolactone decarboxylase
MSDTENAGQTRLPYPDAETPPGVLNVERMFGHIPPDLAAGFGAFSRAVITGETLDPLLRELAILRVGHLSHCAYEVHQHNAFARYLGMPEQKIAAIAEGPGAAVFDAPERALLDFVDDLVLRVRPSDAALAAIREVLELPALFALILATGQYMTVCRILETTGVPIEPVEGLAVSRLSGAAEAQ